MYYNTIAFLVSKKTTWIVFFTCIAMWCILRTVPSFRGGMSDAFGAIRLNSKSLKSPLFWP